MSFFDKLFKRKDDQAKAEPAKETRKDVPGQKKFVLSLEGTQFPLLTAEAGFFEECLSSGQAALVLPFSEYWATGRRGYQAKAIISGRRLLCSSCLVDMAMSFEMSLPGGMMGSGMIAVGEGLPSNLFEAAKTARCPHCGSDKGIILYDHPNYGEISDKDMEALRELWRFRAQVWWSQNNRTGGICDRCNATIARGEGYHRGSEVICQDCAMKCTDASALEALRKNPDYYGASELRRARNFKGGSYKLERGTILKPA